MIIEYNIIDKNKLLQYTVTSEIVVNNNQVVNEINEAFIGNMEPEEQNNLTLKKIVVQTFEKPSENSKNINNKYWVMNK